MTPAKAVAPAVLLVVACSSASRPPAESTTVAIPAASASAEPSESDLPSADTAAPRRQRLDDLVDRHCQGRVADPPVKFSVGPDAPWSEPLTLPPGSCLTVVAVGLVAGDGMSLVAELPGAPPGMESPVLAIAQIAADGSAVLGGEGRCFTNALPIPLPAQVRVTGPSASGSARTCLWDRSRVPVP